MPETLTAFRRLSTPARKLPQQLRIEAIARNLGMSVSGFQHHFKSVTSISPIQFRKHLLLQEARRLVLSENLDAGSAAALVGYENPSYFNREYNKQFGAPPQRDIARLRSNLELGIGMSVAWR